MAGDLLPAKESDDVNTDGIVATGVYVIGEWGGGDADKDKLITDVVDDQVDLTGRAFMGLTVACARCHDHKFDPVSADDYYGLAGIFFSSHILPNPGPKTGGPSVLRVLLARPKKIERNAWRPRRSRRAERDRGVQGRALRRHRPRRRDPDRPVPRRPLGN